MHLANFKSSTADRTCLMSLISNTETDISCPAALPASFIDACRESLSVLSEATDAQGAALVRWVNGTSQLIAVNDAGAIDESTFPKSLAAALLRTCSRTWTDLDVRAAKGCAARFRSAHGQAVHGPSGEVFGAIFLLGTRVASFPPPALRLLDQTRQHIESRLRDLARDEASENNHLRRIFNAIPAPIFVKDAQHRWIDCNRAAAELTGKPRCEILGRPDTEIFGASDTLEQGHADDSWALDSGENIATEGPLSLPDGNERQYISFKAPLDDPSGATRLVGTMFDTTRYRHYTRALEFIDAAVTGGTGLDLYASLTRYLCSAFEVEVAIVGRIGDDGEAVETLAARHNNELLDSFRYPLRGTPFEEICSHGPCIFERNANRIYPDDKWLVSMGVSGYAGVPLKASDGRLLGVMAIMSKGTLTNAGVAAPLLQLFASRIAAEIEREETMTILKEARDTSEKALADLKLQKEVLDCHAIVAMTDQAGRITYVNDKFCEISGYTEDELLGRNHRLLKSGYHAPSFYKELWQTISSGKVWQGEIRNRAKDGSPYWLNTTIAPMYTRNGRIRGYIALRTDITARKEAELELHNAKEKAEFANEAKSRFIANMSHELRTPMNAIIGFTDTMLGGIFGEVQPTRYQDYLGDVNSSARLLLDLINNLLDVAKIEAGRMESYPEPIEVRPILTRTLRMLEPRASAKGVELVIEHSDPDVLIFADLRHVRQIVQNLLTNAVKFTDNGGRVTLSARHLEPEMIAIEVLDTGVGIADTDIQTVMQPFAQAERTARTVEEGTGLGLPLSYRLTTLNRGSMWIESAQQSGTRVTVAFPVFVDEDDRGPCAPSAPGNPAALMS